MRAEPDVSLVADPQTGVLFTQTYSKPNGGTEQKESWIGGTSLSAPLMAGIATLADQARTGRTGSSTRALPAAPAARPSTTSRPAAGPWRCCATG